MNANFAVKSELTRLSGNSGSSFSPSPEQSTHICIRSSVVQWHSPGQSSTSNAATASTWTARAIAKSFIARRRSQSRQALDWYRGSKLSAMIQIPKNSNVNSGRVISRWAKQNGFLIATDNTSVFLDRDWYGNFFYVILRICYTFCRLGRV